MADETDFSRLVGETVTALCHPVYRESTGVIDLDVLTESGRVYRFVTETFDGERVEAGWTCEHFSLILKELDEPQSQDDRTNLVGTVTSVQVIRADEWLGPVDQSLDSWGVDPREVFTAKAGLGPSSAQVTTVVSGVLLSSDRWRLLVKTHGFWLHVDFTTDARAVDEFLDHYT